MLDKKENLNYYEGMKYFKEYINDIEGQDATVNLYSTMKKEYEEKIEKGEIQIECELTRLNCNILTIQRSLSNVGWYFVFCTTTIMTNVMLLVLAYLIHLSFLKLAIGITALCVDVIAVIFYKAAEKKKEEKFWKSVVLQIALEVLQQIQKEKEEEKQKAKEEQRDLEKKERIEKYMERGNITNELAKEAIKEIAATALNKTNLIGKTLGHFLGRKKDKHF